MLNNIKFSLLIVSLFSAAPTYAHHSFAATFSDQIITVEGTVERFKYSNPHVIIYFNVTDEQGKETEWLAEGGSATTMRNQGWDRDTLSEGDYIRITGQSTRNGSPMVSMQEDGSVTFVDPTTGKVIGAPGEAPVLKEGVFNMPLQLSNGLPNFSSAWTGEATGRIGRPILHVPPMDYNEIGAALQAEFDPVNDPQVQCEPPGLVRQAGFSPHPVRIKQYDDHIILMYEEYAGLRTVYFDNRDMVGGKHTHLGQSIARYEGQKLIIETSHLLPNLSATTGNPLTGQTTTVETYYRQDKPNGRAVLRLDLVATDPGYLLTPWTISWSKYAEEGYQFIINECEKPLTN